jgi:hypothetical protein
VFAKTCCVIVAVGAFGCALLAMRQARLQAASELTQTQLRISKLDHRLCDLRARIAAGTTPTQVEKLAAGLGEFRPMVPDDGSAEPVDPRKTPAAAPRQAQSTTPHQQPAARHAGR